MELSCPHCHARRVHARPALLGQWAICPECESPFAWRGRVIRPGTGCDAPTRDRGANAPADEPKGAKS